MLAHARAQTDDEAIRYERTDLGTLSLPEGAFELAYSSLAFHYLADFGRMAQLLFRAVVPGGRLVFSIEHPIYMASTDPRWLVRPDGERAWPVDHYALEGERRTDWLAPGVVKYHRRMATTLNALTEAGWRLLRVLEWAPSPEQLQAEPSLEDEIDRPMMLLVSADR